MEINTVCDARLTGFYIRDCMFEHTQIQLFVETSTGTQSNYNLIFILKLNIDRHNDTI